MGSSIDEEATVAASADTLMGSSDPIALLQSWVGSKQEPRALARELRQAFDRMSKSGEVHASLTTSQIDLALGDESIHLDIFLSPSIFAPEEWSITFLEGLLRKPLHHYANKDLIELGTGSGWVSLALLQLTELRSALGADLNPHAVVLAHANAILNSFDALTFEPLPSRLHERFRSTESDLLAGPIAEGARADFIVGCIPQVIAPEPSINMQSTEGLYDLGNYFVAQGMVEDQFGLGLNARALQEALAVLQPDGRVCLNLAGRPGEAAVERMWLRRGFRPEILWRARVRQAGDTDITPLVDLEARTGEPTAFYAHRHSPSAIPARVAAALLAAGRPIYHELQVVEGTPCSDALVGLARHLRGLCMEEVITRADLSAASDEQLQFVSRLAAHVQSDPRAPYPHEAGDLRFRRRLVGFLSKFHGVNVSPEETFAAPSREELLYCLLHCALERGRRGGVVAAAGLRGAYGRALDKFGADPVWLQGDDLVEVAELIPLLSPLLVVLQAGRRHAGRDLEAVLGACEEAGALLLLDDSDSFAITSQETECPGMQFLQAHRGSPHLAVAVGLVHSAPFPDVHLGLLVARDEGLMRAMAAAAEVTYSRISFFHQFYYDSLFDELLTFRVDQKTTGTSSPSARDPSPGPAEGPGARGKGARVSPDSVLARAGVAISSTMQSILDLPAFSRPGPKSTSTIRLDYGENELPMPRDMQVGVLCGFLEPPAPGAAGGGAPPALREERQSATAAAVKYFQATRLPSARPEHVLLGPGALPLIHDGLLAAATLARRTGGAAGRTAGGRLRVLLPHGSYGVFEGVVAAVGGEVVWLPTAPPWFLVSAAAVAAAPPFDVLLLASPGNPSGAANTSEELQAITEAAAARGARVILDEAYGLLADLGAGPAPPLGPAAGTDRWGGLSPGAREALLVVCTASKEFAGGGVRLGLCASASSEWLGAMRALRLSPVPTNVQVVAEAMFESVGPSAPAGAWGEVGVMRAALREQRAALAGAFRAAGAEVHDGESSGALFFCVDVAGAAGSSGSSSGEEWVERLEGDAGVRMNLPAWSRTGGLARACYSLRPARLHEAADRIRALGVTP